MRVITLQIFCSNGNEEPIRKALEEVLMEMAITDTPLATDPHIYWCFDDKDEVLE